jgi:hypothetical protein
MIRCIPRCVLTLTAGIALTACGNNPNSPLVALPFREGSYFLSLITAVNPMLTFGLPTPSCAAATVGVWQESQVSLKPDGNRWRATPLTAADGVFEMVFEPAEPWPLLGPLPTAQGTLKGVVHESRSGFPVTTVRIGDGSAAVSFTGGVTSRVSTSAQGTVSGSTVVGGTGVVSFTCPAGTTFWILHGYGY